MFAVIFKLFLDIFLFPTPVVECRQIGDNQYTCDAYWR